MNRLSKFNFTSKKYGPLENCSEWHDIVNELNFGSVEAKEPSMMSITPDTKLTDEVYDLISKANNTGIDERLLMKAVADTGIDNYMDRLLAIDCIKKGMILARCKITGGLSVIN